MRSFQDARQIKLRWHPQSFEEKSSHLRRLLREGTFDRPLTIYDLKGTSFEKIEPEYVSIREFEAELCCIRLKSHPGDNDTLLRIGHCIQAGVVIKAKQLRDTKFEFQDLYLLRGMDYYGGCRIELKKGENKNQIDVQVVEQSKPKRSYFNLFVSYMREKSKDIEHTRIPYSPIQKNEINYTHNRDGHQILSRERFRRSRRNNGGD